MVLQNTVNKDKTTGIIDTVNVHFNLLPRGAYVQTAGQHAVLNPVKPSDKSPLQLYEAINAVQIAEAMGAAKYTPDIFAKAQQELQNAQALDGKKSQRKVMITYARGAVQDAEDARVSTLRKMQQEKEQQQQLAMQQAQAAAQQAQIDRATGGPAARPGRCAGSPGPGTGGAGRGGRGKCQGGAGCGGA